METEFCAYLISALEEDSQLSRLLACRSVSLLITVTKGCLNPGTLNKIYPGTVTIKNHLPHRFTLKCLFTLLIKLFQKRVYFYTFLNTLFFSLNHMFYLCVF